MKKIFFIIVFVLCSQFYSSAKKLDSLSFTNHKEFFLHWDNDMFVFKDYYYTQGAKFYFVNPGFRKNPVNHILPRLKNADLYYGLGAIQEIYTPKDVADTLLNLVDRPYAGTLYIRSFITSSEPEKRLRFTSQFDLGFLGPLAGAGQAQKYIHDWLGLDWPKGWDFQIENRPYINYNLQLEKGIISAPGVFDFIGSSTVRVGNIHDDLQMGALFRLGRINNFFKGYNLGNKNYAENKDFQWFIYGGGKVKGVLYNATLMGGIIPPGETEHSFKFNQINNIVGEVYGGMQMTYKFVGLRGQVTWKSPEFETGEQHGWGTFSMYIRF